MFLSKERWSPYLVGFFIALLAIGSLVIFHKTIGTSTTFVKLAALFWKIVNPAHFQNNSYYQEYLKNKSWFDWQFMLVIGIFIGAYLSKKSNKKAVAAETPKNKFTVKSLAAFFGGIIIMIGARFAGGCTSGHAISGGFQLALSGWLFMIGAFALGIPTALILYRKKQGDNQ